MTPSRRELQTARRRCHPGSESLAARPATVSHGVGAAWHAADTAPSRL